LDGFSARLTVDLDKPPQAYTNDDLGGRWKKWKNGTRLKKKIIRYRAYLYVFF
jgi:hypothetical protein